MKMLLGVVRHHPIALIGHAFVAFSVFWTITEAFTHFFGWTALKDYRWFAVIIALSIIYSLYALWKPSKIMVRIPMSNVSIEVKFGDIFDCDGIATIPMNEFFDSELGLPVSPSSLHGIFIQKYFNGEPDALDKQLELLLQQVHSEYVLREKGKSRKYPIGTCAMIEASGKNYLAFAFSHTDPGTCKASADVPLMFKALSGLWQGARVLLNGNSLYLPLIGSGLSGVGLPARDLVNILILSFVDETKRQVITQKMSIILTWDRADEIDLSEIKKIWEGK